MEGEQPYLGDLLTMVVNHLLTGMILQVGGDFNPFGMNVEMEVFFEAKLSKADKMMKGFFLKKQMPRS